MLKRRASLLRFLCILGQAGVLGELEELLTDQSHRHKVIFIKHVGVTFYISLSTLPTTEVACPLAASGGSIRPWQHIILKSIHVHLPRSSCG